MEPVLLGKIGAKYRSIGYPSGHQIYYNRLRPEADYRSIEHRLTARSMRTTMPLIRVSTCFDKGNEVEETFRLLIPLVTPLADASAQAHARGHYESERAYVHASRVSGISV